VSSIHSPTYDAALEARFAKAARHSRLVRFLRVAVPVVVTLSMAVIVLRSTIYNPFKTPENLPTFDPGKLAVSGTKITMESPHLAGYTPDKRPYEVWAKTATQDITDPDHVELSTLRGKMLMADQSTLLMDARTGLFDSKKQLLDLRKDIYLRTSAGYEARLNQAFVDIGKGTVTSDQHVEVTMTDGTLTSDRLRVTEGGQVIRFEGNVVMHIDKLDNGAAASAPQAPAEPARPVKTRATREKSENSR